MTLDGFDGRAGEGEVTCGGLLLHAPATRPTMRATLVACRQYSVRARHGLHGTALALRCTVSSIHHGRNSHSRNYPDVDGGGLPVGAGRHPKAADVALRRAAGEHAARPGLPAVCAGATDLV